MCLWFSRISSAFYCIIEYSAVAVPELQLWLQAWLQHQRRGRNTRRGVCVCVLLKQPVGMCARKEGAKQEDEVIAKVRGGEEGGECGCGRSLDEWHLFQRWAQQQRLEPLPPSPPPFLFLPLFSFLSLSPPPPPVCRLGRCFVVTARDWPASVEWTRTASRDAGVCWHGGRLVSLELLLSQAVETG